MAVVDKFPSKTTEQFGDFEEWSSATSSDGCLGDWSDFHDSKTWDGDRPASPVPAQERSSKCIAAVQSCEAPDPWGVFSECFPDAGPQITDLGDLETPTLSELLRSPSHTPSQSGGISSGVMSVCGRLLCEGSTVRWLGPRPSTQSFSQLLSTLPLVDPHTHNTEDMALPDMELEKTEDQSPPAALIQTKLSAPSCCHQTPPVMYQVSLRWIRLCNIQLQAHKHQHGK
ncbi:hypothetical protein AALO_G00001240 [Alosa alosa]|uniref:Uncharacterized protein n=1 Tax=Alosa alosa TaxID=278164 RepID=A0AAV6HH91_9TELE|nr:uncharacterized protein LOC125304141 [Alosa alosa]XP_048114145.1 uncharacterized protein LOC125304141 [Alosa alosa]KAG5285252.1 hypothetical protein AALO_G00001240 [Alosa alosa]